MSGRWKQNLRVSAIRKAIYRPFTFRYLYFDSIMTHRQGQFPVFFPPLSSENENTVICVAGPGADHQTVIAAKYIVDVKCGINGNSTIQCFPYYTYAADGSNQRDNITDWALAQFQARYGEQVSKWDIFHYVYAMLHHPQYRERYAENLKRDLPHIPLLRNGTAFEVCVHIGKQLMELHLNYEQAAEYRLQWVENRDVPVNWRVEKMRLTPNKDALVVNDWLTFQAYRRSASSIAWAIAQPWNGSSINIRSVPMLAVALPATPTAKTSQNISCAWLGVWCR